VALGEEEGGAVAIVNGEGDGNRKGAAVARGVEWRWRMEYTKHIGVLRQFKVSRWVTTREDFVIGGVLWGASLDL
jgi:hypothetical protein